MREEMRTLRGGPEGHVRWQRTRSVWRASVNMGLSVWQDAPGASGSGSRPTEQPPQDPNAMFQSLWSYHRPFPLCSSDAYRPPFLLLVSSSKPFRFGRLRVANGKK